MVKKEKKMGHRQSYGMTYPIQTIALIRAGAAVMTIILLFSCPAFGLVRFDEGSRIIKGVQLLQVYNNPSEYCYLPTFPRLATKKQIVTDDTEGAEAEPVFELLCIKYVGDDNIPSGGLFHALIEFTLPPEIVKDLEKELKKDVPNGRIVGPVPLLQTAEEGEDALGSFEIVSAVLTDIGEDRFTRNVITSRRAPLTPGSKAAVAAILNQQGATLLWETFQGETSDVSVAIRAYYEAAVKGYNAIVTAEMDTVYEHFSRVYNVQKDYTRRQLRKIVDELERDGVLKVEVFDRSAGTGIETNDMESILNIVTNKLTELMFDHKTGWAKEPPREVAVEMGQIPGRQKRSWFSRTFGGTHDTKYYTDDQYVAKKRKDIQRNRFYLNLSKSSTIKVHVDTAGNLGGLYGQYQDDPRYFRVVDLGTDSAYQEHTVYFQIDGDYTDAFKDTVNLASVNFRKKYVGNRPDFTESLVFSHEKVNKGETSQQITFPRLGLSGDWQQYEYQVRWSIRDIPTLVGSAEEEWIQSRDPAISLAPPFRKRTIDVEADLDSFKTSGMTAADVDFAAYLGGETKKVGAVKFRTAAANPESVASVTIYHDRGSNEDRVGYRVTWYSRAGTKKQGNWQLLDTDYIFLVAPASEDSDPDSNGGGS